MVIMKMMMIWKHIESRGTVLHNGAIFTWRVLYFKAYQLYFKIFVFVK